MSAQNITGRTSGGEHMDKMLSILMEDTRFFRIGEKQYEFYDHDPIFTIS